MKKSLVITTSLWMCFFLFLSFNSFAQTGNITGKVIDKDGKLIAMDLEGKDLENMLKDMLGSQ